MVQLIGQRSILKEIPTRRGVQKGHEGTVTAVPVGEPIRMYLTDIQPDAWAPASVSSAHAVESLSARGQSLSLSWVSKSHPATACVRGNSIDGDMAKAETMTRAGAMPNAGRCGATAPSAWVPADSAKNQTRRCSPSTCAHCHSSCSLSSRI